MGFNLKWLFGLNGPFLANFKWPLWCKYVPYLQPISSAFPSPLQMVWKPFTVIQLVTINGHWTSLMTSSIIEFNLQRSMRISRLWKSQAHRESHNCLWKNQDPHTQAITFFLFAAPFIRFCNGQIIYKGSSLFVWKAYEPPLPVKSNQR